MSLVTSTATKTKWNAADYAANSTVQQSWARELIAKLNLHGAEYILDLGCGDGKVTAELARAVPRGAVVGIDASTEMVSFARKAFPPAKIPNLKFQIADARKINPAGRVSQFDIVFSNAALHWVDDHQAILHGAASMLKPGGRLVISCGGKGNAHDVFLALRPEMRLKQWCKFFRGMTMPYFFYAPTDYEKWLSKFGFKINAIKLTPRDATYAGAKSFATWLRTTWIPYVQRVPEKVGQPSSRFMSGKMPDPRENLREEFIAAVTQRYLVKHPPDADGKVHVKMVRLEIDAIKT